MRISGLDKACFKIILSPQKGEKVEALFYWGGDLTKFPKNRADIIVLVSETESFRDKQKGVGETGCFPVSEDRERSDRQKPRVSGEHSAERSEAYVLEMRDRVRTLARIKGEPLVIEGPGEYEKKGVFIQAIKTSKNNGQNQTFYSLEAEGMRLACFLGSSQKVLSPEQLESLGSIDILVMPLAKQGLLPKEMVGIFHQIEPRMIVLLEGDRTEGRTKPSFLEDFLRESGLKISEKDSQLTILAKDFKEEITQLKVLTPNSLAKQ